MLPCQNKSRTCSSFSIFGSAKRLSYQQQELMSSLAILLTKSKINHPSYRFSKLCIIPKSMQSNLILVLVPILESKGPY